MRRVLSCMILLIVFCWPLVHRASAAPRVVASIKPVHSLVAGVMKGVGEPRLLLKGAADARWTSGQQKTINRMMQDRTRFIDSTSRKVEKRVT